jgi:hypothetical protein
VGERRRVPVVGRRGGRVAVRGGVSAGRTRAWRASRAGMGTHRSGGAVGGASCGWVRTCTYLIQLTLCATVEPGGYRERVGWT